jgi:hypothetical protein
MKSAAFWVVNTVQFEERARIFGGTNRLHLQVRKVRQARNLQKQVASRKGSVCWILLLVLLVACIVLLFDTEDGNDLFFQNVTLSPKYTAL